MKIRPEIRGPKNYYAFTDLDVTLHSVAYLVGDTFIWHVSLYRKLADNNDKMVKNHVVVNLSNNTINYQMCDEQVLPVDVVIDWTVCVWRRRTLR